MTIDIPFWLAVSASSEVDAELAPSGSILFNLLVILLLVFLNGFFVASEFALVKVRSTQLDALEERGQEGGVGATADVASGCLSFRYSAWHHARRAWHSDGSANLTWPDSFVLF